MITSDLDFVGRGAAMSIELEQRFLICTAVKNIKLILVPLWKKQWRNSFFWLLAFCPGELSCLRGEKIPKRRAYSPTGIPSPGLKSNHGII